MRIHVIVAKRKKQNDEPWIVDAWDEESIDGNVEGWDEALENAVSSNGDCEIRVGVIEVSGTFLDDLFQPLNTEGKIVK